jgi:hypothetical protein
MKTYAIDVNTLNTKCDEIMGKSFPFSNESFVYPFVGFSIGVTLGSQIEKRWGEGGGGCIQ